MTGMFAAKPLWLKFERDSLTVEQVIVPNARWFSPHPGFQNDDGYGRMESLVARGCHNALASRAVNAQASKHVIIIVSMWILVKRLSNFLFDREQLGQNNQGFSIPKG